MWNGRETYYVLMYLILPLCPINPLMLRIFVHHAHLTPLFMPEAHAFFFFKVMTYLKNKNYPIFRIIYSPKEFKLSQAKVTIDN